MSTTYTLTEGNDALNRVLLMMRYDLEKTLNENVISEQVYTKTNDGNYELKSPMFKGIEASKIFPNIKDSNYPTKLDSQYTPIEFPKVKKDPNNPFKQTGLNNVDSNFIYKPSIAPEPYRYTEFGYPSNHAYFERWKKEWQQKHPGEKLGHKQQTLDQNGRASEVWADEYGNETPIVIEAPTLSEGILKMREFFFSGKGIATQIVLSIVGAEIGVPLIFNMLDIVIIINDAYIMARDWNYDGPDVSVESNMMGGFQTEGLWKWFNYHFTRNLGFQNLVIDLLAVAAGAGIMGLGKMALKSSRSVFKALIKKWGPNFMKKLISSLEHLNPKTEGLPKEFKSFVDKKFSEINKAIELWKTPGRAVKTTVQPLKLVFATAAYPTAIAVTNWLEEKRPKIIKFLQKFFNSDEVTDEVTVKDDGFESDAEKQLKNNLEKANPDIFSKKNPIKSFKAILKIEKKVNVNGEINYMLINGEKYKFEGNGLKLKKI
jgi:hypothetical protein